MLLEKKKSGYQTACKHHLFKVCLYTYIKKRRLCTEMLMIDGFFSYFYLMVGDIMYGPQGPALEGLEV